MPKIFEFPKCCGLMIVADLPGQSGATAGPVSPPEPGYEQDVWGYKAPSGWRWSLSYVKGVDFQKCFIGLLANTILNKPIISCQPGISVPSGYFTDNDAKRRHATHIVIDLNKYQLEALKPGTLDLFEPISRTEYINPNSDYKNSVFVLKAPRDALRTYLDKEAKVA